MADDAEKIQEVLDENAALRAKVTEQENENATLREHMVIQEREIAAMQFQGGGVDGPEPPLGDGIYTGPLCKECNQSYRAVGVIAWAGMFCLFACMDCYSLAAQWAGVSQAVNWLGDHAAAIFLTELHKGPLHIGIMVLSSGSIYYLAVADWHWKLARYGERSKLEWLYKTWQSVRSAYGKMHDAFRSGRPKGKIMTNEFETRCGGRAYGAKLLLIALLVGENLSVVLALSGCATHKTHISSRIYVLPQAPANGSCGEALASRLDHLLRPAPQTGECVAAGPGVTREVRRPAPEAKSEAEVETAPEQTEQPKPVVEVSRRTRAGKNTARRNTAATSDVVPRVATSEPADPRAEPLKPADGDKSGVMMGLLGFAPLAVIGLWRALSKSTKGGKPK